MSLTAHYYEMNVEMQSDLAMVATNAALRQLLAAEIAELVDFAVNLQTPVVVTEGAVEYTLQCKIVSRQRLFLLELQEVLQLSFSDLQSRVQARQE